jgi:hypothetical protein
MKGLVVHAVIFAVSAGLALSVWSRDETAALDGPGEKVEVWSGNADSVSGLRFESPKLSLVLDAQKDTYGRYYVASVDKEEPKPPRSAPDAGAPEPGKRVTSRFVAVKAAEELVQKLAPLSALRRIGAFEPGRAEEFGLKEPEGTLKVKLGGAEQSLVIGSSTPGGQERYARHVASNTVYAVDGDLTQSLLSADSRLLEREFHGFADAEISRIRVSRGGKSREFVQIAEKKGSWADAASPAQVEQTVGNWLGKVDRLRVSEYVEKPAQPIAPEGQLRIEYFGGGKPLGFLELHAVPGEKGNDYLVRTEYTRWYAKVITSAAEQVEQDLAGLLK